jgi:hypothetical protein
MRMACKKWKVYKQVYLSNSFANILVKASMEAKEEISTLLATAVPWDPSAVALPLTHWAAASHLLCVLQAITTVAPFLAKWCATIEVR